jgi:phosphohistidine phosphatase
LKHLLLLRHAKAAPAEPGMADRDRPLAARGHRDAALIAEAIAEDWPPDLILSSPSLRTLETMADVTAALPAAPRTIADESLYGGDRGAYLAALAEHGGGARRLLVVGHNPTIHETAVMLAKSPEAGMRAKFPTAALAVLAFDVDDWSMIRPGKGRLVRFLRPKDLGARDADD